MTINYDEYIVSDEWKARRRVAREKVGNKCQLCGARGVELHVHHNTYEHLGHEPDEDLIVLCAECHTRHHAPDPAHTTHTGMVCPECGAEWAVSISLEKLIG